MEDLTPIGDPGRWQDLSLERCGDAALITMHRLKKDPRAARQAGNNLDDRLMGELKAALALVEGDPGIKSIVLASGHRLAFCIGAKIDQVLGATFDQALEFVRNGQELLLMIHRLKKPVVAALNGLTFGGGLELAMACDYRICGDRENVRLGLPETSLGVIPAMGGTQNLVRLIGEAKAKEFILTAKVDIDAGLAKSDGLVDRVVASDVLVSEALGFARSVPAKRSNFDLGAPTTDRLLIRREIEERFAGWRPDQEREGRGAPLAQALVHYVFETTSPRSFLDAILHEQEAFARLSVTADAQEGVRAMLEERKPVFRRK